MESKGIREAKKAEFSKKAETMGVPEHDIEGMVSYIVEGRPMGGFLTAVFSNDLMEAYCRADDENTKGLSEVVGFIYNYAPTECHGSPEKVRLWLKKFKAVRP